MVPRLLPHSPRKVPGNQTSLIGDVPHLAPSQSREGPPSSASGGATWPRISSPGASPPPPQGGSHAAAGRDLAAVPEPSHLRPWEAGDAWGADDGRFSVGDALVLLTFLKAPHVCGREGHMEGSGAGGRQPRLPGSRAGSGGSGRKLWGRQDARGARPPCSGYLTGPHHPIRHYDTLCFVLLGFVSIYIRMSLKQWIHPTTMRHASLFQTVYNGRTSETGSLTCPKARGWNRAEAGFELGPQSLEAGRAVPPSLPCSVAAGV